MPNTPAKIFQQLGIEDEALKTWESIKSFGALKAGTIVNKGEIIFPRVEFGVENAAQETPKEDNYITIDDFAKIDLRVAKVLECEKVEGSDKLLKLQLEVGSEKRQVVSGISKYYAPEDLVGRSVVLVANLKPVKIRGIESNGMILAADAGDSVVVVTPLSEIPSGSKVR